MCNPPLPVHKECGQAGDGLDCGPLRLGSHSLCRCSVTALNTVSESPIITLCLEFIEEIPSTNTQFQVLEGEEPDEL